MPSQFGFFLSLPGIVAERVGSTRARQFFRFVVCCLLGSCLSGWFPSRKQLSGQKVAMMTEIMRYGWKKTSSHFTVLHCSARFLLGVLD